MGDDHNCPNSPTRSYQGQPTCFWISERRKHRIIINIYGKILTNLQKKTFIVELVNMIMPILDLSHKRGRTLRIGEVSASWFEAERISGSETFVRPINL